MTGLSDAEAARRLAEDGHNELPRRGRRTFLRIALEVIREPMLALLIIGGVIYLLLGDRTEALMLLAFASLSVIITVVQETRTERVLEALRDLTSPRALVIRGGERKRIAGRDVVRGDLIVLGEGDRVPADGHLIEATHLQADESLLTGESVAVDRRRNESVFSGSLIVRGSGVAVVTGTGKKSEIGKIGASLREVEFEPPRLQTEMRRLVRVFGLIGVSASVAAILLYGFLRGGWLDALLAGIALGMSMLPEEFPVVLTVFMAMGAWRISRARVLTRKAAAIESLGAATVLCTDKTGTLTENRMSVEALISSAGAQWRRADGIDAFPESLRLAAEAGALASAPQPFDPMEKAFHRLFADVGGAGAARVLERAYGLQPDLLAVTQAWREKDRCVVATKGAPEAVIDLCRLGAADRAQILAAVDRLAGEGLRVIALARASHDGPLPETPRGFDFEFVGLAGLADPLRETAAAAVAECRSAGVRVVMITGDYPATARAIAEKAGIDGGTLITGDDIAAMNDKALAEAARRASVFARVRPEQKLRIVKALKDDGEIVAMTGDGVNDAPALKASHIGVAMGGRGTDVAREASSIVLLDDDFSAIVTTLRLGRRIHDNLRKATAFILSVHVPIAGMALLPLITGLPIVFGPVHIAFLEMIIDPVCSLVLEAEREEPNIMKRPPRPPKQPLLTRSLAAWSLLQGLVAFGFVGAVYSWAIGRGGDDAEIRALTFAALVTVVFSLIFVNRSYGASIVKALLRRNVALAVVAAFVACVMTLTMTVEPIRALFRFGTLDGPEIAASVAAGVAVLLVLELAKLARPRLSSVNATRRPRPS
ncbi:MAG: cation-translocating P-type ATPase [Parvularculaceae bacterium]|nr:cation-translocating P-type ATPase [Parvularculaceae bacterium]